MTYLKVAQKVEKYMDYFQKTICCQELSKIAQSVHTALVSLPSVCPAYLRRRRLYLRVSSFVCFLMMHFLLLAKNEFKIMKLLKVRRLKVQKIVASNFGQILVLNLGPNVKNKF